MLPAKQIGILNLRYCLAGSILRFQAALLRDS